MDFIHANVLLQYATRNASRAIHGTWFREVRSPVILTRRLGHRTEF